MEEKLRIPKRGADDTKRNTCVVRVSKKAMALINILCADTGRTQSEITSMLIEWAYDRAEVTDAAEGGEDA